MPNTSETQPGRDPDPEREAQQGDEDESLEEEVRRNAERRGGFDDEGRPVRAPEVEPDLSEDEARIAEERGEVGRSPGRSG